MSLNIGSAPSRALVDAAVGLLDCVEIDVQEDDVYFYDRMAGAVCYHSASDFTVVRHYAHSQSVDQVLTDWAPLLNTTRRVVSGADWFALGRSDDVARIHARFPESSDPSMTTSPPQDLTPIQDEMSTCVRFATSLLTISVSDPAQYRSQSAELDHIYP